MILRNKWKNILAWVSVGLNVVLIGIILIGPATKKPRPPGPPSPISMFEKMGKDLTGQDKVFFDKILAKYGPEMESYHKNMKGLFHNIETAVKKAPFKITNVEAAHHALHQNRMKMDETIESFVHEMLVGLSDDGRQKLKFGPPKKP